MTVSHENFITFNCSYVYIKYFNYYFNFCVSKSFYYSTGDALLRKAFTHILTCCDIHFTYILLHIANLLNRYKYKINKLICFGINDVKLLEKKKAIWTSVEDLKRFT